MVQQPVASPIKKIQVFGERCSGTNYLEQLLARNFPSTPLVWDYGYKHFFPQAPFEHADDCLFIVLHREPIAWLRSLHRTPWHVAPPLRKLPFSAFIRHQWWCIWDAKSGKSRRDPLFGTEMMFERDPVTGDRFANVVQMREAKVRVWLSLCEQVRHGLSLRFEDLRNDPDGFTRRLTDEHGLQAAHGFQPVRRYKGVKWYQGWKTRLTRRPLAPVSDQDRDFIIGQLDRAVERAAGYDLPRPAVAASGL